jgi:hypothetical protein
MSNMQCPAELAAWLGGVLMFGRGGRQQLTFPEPIPCFHASGAGGSIRDGTAKVEPLKRNPTRTGEGRGPEAIEGSA